MQGFIPGIESSFCLFAWCAQIIFLFGQPRTELIVNLQQDLWSKHSLPLTTMSDRRRRKSLSIFRPTLSSLTPIHDAAIDSAPPGRALNKKKNRTSSFFSPSRSSSPSSPSSPVLERTYSANSYGMPSSPISRPRTLQRPERPSSKIFGSLRSMHSAQDEDERLVRTSSKHSSIDEETTAMLNVSGMVVLHHGEVQMTAGIFRKKSLYLVLTDTHLLRFKSQAKAADVFPSIPASLGRSNTMRHSRMSSSGSLYELQISAEAHFSVPLHNIVAAYKLDDGRPYFSIEIAYLDEASNNASAMTLQCNDPRESDGWLSVLRAAIRNSRLTDPLPFEKKTIEYVARAMEYESDYDPQHFRMFKVVTRATKSGGRSSSDDLTKLTSNVCYLGIGIHKIHLIPLQLQKSAKPASNTSLSDLSGDSYGIATLSSVYVQESDDAFQLGFRIPLKQASLLYLASSCVDDIARSIRQTADFIRPEWIQQPFMWDVPQNLEESLLPSPTYAPDDHLHFDRTLIAYCVGYNIDASNIRYTVNYSCDDAPEFELLAPTNPRRTNYSLLELLAVMRALRYNESFSTIAFRNVKLDVLYGVYDPYASVETALSTRSGDRVFLPQQDQQHLWLIVHEIQSLALKSRRLRRLDFCNSLSRKPTDTVGIRDRGNGICEAIFPLCLQQLTNVDWIVLNGITLSDSDVDYVFAAAVEKLCHFRALEMSRCGLTDRSLRTVLQAMSHQRSTLESINLAGNMARLSPESFHQQIECFQHIRILNFSNVPITTGPPPFMTSEILLSWRLEDLNLSGIHLNPHSLEALATYLANSQSDTLRFLRLNQCQLTGKDVSNLLRATVLGRDQSRTLHLYVSENHLEQEHDALAESFRRSESPSHITMQMLEYDDERKFQALIAALSSNVTLKYLDMSRTSLPLDASEETCKTLRFLFETNRNLEEFDISGEQSHLEVVTLGTGLSAALKGLERNKSLKILRIERQALELPGANALASVLQSNSTLREIHCENNKINLQAFTTLVNAVNHNTSLMYLPNMDKDRAIARKNIDREIDGMRQNAQAAAVKSGKATVRRTVGAAIAGGRSFSSRSITHKSAEPPKYTEQDLKAAVGSLEQNWELQVSRLQSYLQRNYCLANGIPVPEIITTSPRQSQSSDRPPTAESLMTALRDATLDRTPTVELDFQLGEKSAAYTTSGVGGGGGGGGGGDDDYEANGYGSPNEYGDKEYNEKFVAYEEDGDDVGPGLMMAKEI